MNKIFLALFLSCCFLHLPVQAAEPIWEESVKNPAAGEVSATPKAPQRIRHDPPRIYIEPNAKEQTDLSEKLKKNTAAAKTAPTAKKPARNRPAAAARPATRWIMRTPQYADFTTVKNEAGGYQLAVPKCFGSDPLASLPSSQGPMLLRISDNNCMCAATVADAGDTVSYKPAENLPDLKNSRTLYTWQHGSSPVVWTCRLSSCTDFYGSKMQLKAVCSYQGRSYQLLYMFPSEKINTFLPQALYSLNSFRFLTNK